MRWKIDSFQFLRLFCLSRFTLQTLDDRWLYFEISDFTFFLHFLLMFLAWIGGLMQWKIISFCTPDSFWWFIIVKLVPKHTACTFKNNTCHVLFCFLFIYICFLKILVDQRPGLMKTLMKPKKTQYSLIDDTDNGIVLGFLLWQAWQ